MFSSCLEMYLRGGGGGGLYLGHELGGGVAQRLQHRRGLGVEQGHPIGHLVVDLVLRLQLRTDNLSFTRSPEQRHFSSERKRLGPLTSEEEEEGEEEEAAEASPAGCSAGSC